MKTPLLLASLMLTVGLVACERPAVVTTPVVVPVPVPAPGPPGPAGEAGKPGQPGESTIVVLPGAPAASEPAK
jgi:hypothetical protein